MQDPRIIDFEGKTVVGHRIRTNLLEHRESELWRSLRSSAHEVTDRVGTDFFSVKVYGSEYSFSHFDPAAKFDKWAAVEVFGVTKQPDGFENLVVPAGTYAVFIHRGTPSRANVTFGYIFSSWLPNSIYELEDRPHFEVLGVDWSPFDENAEEEVWVPIKTSL